ncbi:hypothetical protein [Propionicimonas sp.]|uniref:hypothetical protein n=1 Tax=Propionicimonas sp. TaxID=1955623 RepID=UPI0039E54B18
MPEISLTGADRNRRAVALGVLALAAVLSVVNQAHMVALGGDNYRTADWLINYAGGFVRRGLFGELLRVFGPGGQATLWVLFGFQLALYAPVFWFVVSYLSRQRWSWPALALACGPLSLPFIGWDPGGGFRKEIIGFLALVVLASLRLRPHRTIAHWTLVGAAAFLWVLGVLSWEPTALMLPAVLHLLLSSNDWLPPRPPHARVLGLGFALVSLAGLGASVLAPGSPEKAAAICASLVAGGNPTPDPCAGAVLVVGQSLSDGMANVASLWPMYAGYPVVMVIAMLPLLLSPWLARNWRWALAAALATAPLYLVAIDYGRWGHILFVELMVCVMLCPAEAIASALWNPVSTLLLVCFAGVPNAGPMNGGTRWPLEGLLGTVITMVQFGVFLAGT